MRADSIAAIGTSDCARESDDLGSLRSGARRVLFKGGISIYRRRDLFAARFMGCNRPVNRERPAPKKRKKPDRLVGVLVGEICLIQWWMKRLIIDAERHVADLKSIEGYLDRLREDYRERD